MPAYNASEHIRDAINSILNQTYSEFVLLIIDDGSTDDTLEIINSIQDNRIKLIKNEKNLGLIDTLNKGLTIIDTEYFARMDADDISFPERFEIQISFLENNTQCGVVGSNYEMFGNVNKFSDLILDPDEIALGLYYDNLMAHPTVMVRKKIMDEHNLFYRKELLHLEDWGLWIELSRHTLITNLPNVLLKYRMEGQNISLKNNDTFEERAKLLYSIYLPFLFDEVDDEFVNNHWNFAKEIYSNESLGELKNRFNELRKIYLANNFKPEIIDSFFKKKYDRLFFGVCNVSPIKGLMFSFKFKVFTFFKLKYVLKAIIGKK